MIKSLTITDEQLYFGHFDHPYIRFTTEYGTLECMIDTGFSLGLVIPAKYARIFEGSTALPADLALGNGAIVEAQSYLVELKREGQSLGLMTAVSFNQKEGLVGIEFLRLWGRTLTLNWQGKRVEFLP